MENFEYSKDYRLSDEEIARRKGNPLDGKVIETLRLYDKIMQQFPKRVIRKDKAAFERLLPQLDCIAKEFYGRFTAKIDHNQKYQATFELILPYLEFTERKECEPFVDLLYSAQLFSIEPRDGGIRLFALINYYEGVPLTDDEIMMTVREQISKQMELSDDNES